MTRNAFHVPWQQAQAGSQWPDLLGVADRMWAQAAELAMVKEERTTYKIHIGHSSNEK